MPVKEFHGMVKCMKPSFGLTRRYRYINTEDFSRALEENDRDTLNRLFAEIIPSLVEYLQVVMNAEFTVAEECVQNALARFYKRISEGKSPPEAGSLFPYLVRAVKNEYLDYVSKERAQGPVEEEDALVSPPDQISRLLDKERQDILRKCLRELKEDAREFIEYWLNYPDADYKHMSQVFGISKTNVTSRRSRILRTLHECFQRRSEK